MVSPWLLAPTLLPGFAALCSGINVRPSSGPAEMPTAINTVIKPALVDLQQDSIRFGGGGGRRRRRRRRSDSSEDEPRPFDPANDGILIYARTKTGTSSLQTTAGKMLQPPCTVHHGDRDPKIKKGKVSKHRALKCHHQECAQYFLKGRPEGSRTWVITSNRNPFTRYPSAMFQGIGHLSSKHIERLDVRDLLGVFHDGGGQEKHVRWTAKDQTLHWYNESFKEPFGLDILAHPFNFDKKFLHVQHTFDNRILEVLVLRLEDTAQWDAILKPFFPTLQLTTANLASDKSSALASKYKEFLSALQYTNKEIDHISKSDELNHFYTREEKDSFILKVRESSKQKLLPDTLAEDLILEDRLDLQGSSC